MNALATPDCIRACTMTVVLNENLLLHPQGAWRDESYLCHDQRLVAGHHAASLLAAAVKRTRLGPLVAQHCPNAHTRKAAAKHGKRCHLARTAGPAAALARLSARGRPGPLHRLATARRPARQPDLGADARVAARLRRDLPMGSTRTPHRAHLAAQLGFAADGTQALCQNAAVRSGHGRRAGMPVRATSRVVRAYPPLAGAALQPLVRCSGSKT